MSDAAQTQEQWTEDESAAFQETLVRFRDGLPPRQRQAFQSILVAAARAEDGDDDVKGYVMFRSGFIFDLTGLLYPDLDPDGLADPFAKGK